MMTYMLKSLVLLFATTALFAHPANADDVAPCEDDPEFEFMVKKDGELKNCAWLKNKKIKQKICLKERSKDGETKQPIADFCPYSCGTCTKKKTECPRKKPEKGADCSKFEFGLICDFNYRYIGSPVDEDLVTCAPTETYVCSTSSTWEAKSILEPSDINRRLSDVGMSDLGKKCDPYECPSEPPEGGTACAKTGLSCPYDYQYQGCSINKGLECRPTIEAICTEYLVWELPPIVKLCSDPEDNQDPLIAEGISCTSCPTVEPEGICPSKKPNDGENCSLDTTIDCKYEFANDGCSPFDIRCDPSKILNCQEGKWVETPNNASFGRFCEEICPLSKPKPNYKCGKSTHSLGYDTGLSCDYDYVNTSCEADAKKCTPTENYTCASTGDERFWERTSVIPEVCENPPPGYLGACEATRRQRRQRMRQRQRR